MNQPSIFHLSSLSFVVISVQFARKQKTSFTASHVETKAQRVFPKEWQGQVNRSLACTYTCTHTYTHRDVAAPVQAVSRGRPLLEALSFKENFAKALRRPWRGRSQTGSGVVFPTVKFCTNNNANIFKTAPLWAQVLALQQYLNGRSFHS